MGSNPLEVSLLRHFRLMCGSEIRFTDFYRDLGWDFKTNIFDLIRVKMGKKSN